MAQTKELTWSGIAMRFIVALLIVFATYNPEGYSFFSWVFQADSSQLALKLFLGVVLIIGWAIYIRATLSSLGGMGITLAIAFFTSLLWLLSDWGIIPAHSARVVSYMLLFIVAALLTTGMCWSHIRRRLSGQMDVDEIESD